MQSQEAFVLLMRAALQARTCPEDDASLLLGARRLKSWAGDWAFHVIGDFSNLNSPTLGPP